MEIAVLGPLRITSAGRRVPLAAKPRLLLAVLVVNANRTVSIDRLVDALWPEEPPLTATRTVHTYVFQLRRVLTDDDGDERLRLITEGQGYRLETDPGAIDADRFETALASARALRHDDAAQAADVYHDALALWQGPAFADVAYESFAEAEIERLTELRAGATEELANTWLDLGRHEEVISELRRAVAELPFREGLWASLMTALYRSGRKAEALLAYRDAESRLVEELGVAPGRELAELAERIRADDPTLVRGSNSVSSPSSSAGAEDDRVVEGVASRPARTRLDRRPRHLGTRSSAAIAVVGLATTLVAAALFLPGSRAGAAPTEAVPTVAASATGTPAAPPLRPNVAEVALLSRIPRDIAATCRPSTAIEGALPNAMASLRCEPLGDAPDVLWYDQLRTRDQVETAWRGAIEQHDIPQTECGDGAPAGVGRWNLGTVFEGAVLCYVEGDRASIWWTYEEDRTILARASTDAEPAWLFAWWEATAPFF